MTEMMFMLRRSPGPCSRGTATPVPGPGRLATGHGPGRRRQDRLPGRDRPRRPALRAEGAPRLAPLHGREGPRLVRRHPDGDAAAREASSRHAADDPARGRAAAPHPHLHGPLLHGRTGCARRSSCSARPWRSGRRSSSSTNPGSRGSSGRRSRRCASLAIGAEPSCGWPCRIHREGPPALPGHLPPPADRLEDLVDLAFRLDSCESKIRLHILKDGESMVDRDLNLLLDAETHLLVPGAGARR